MSWDAELIDDRGHVEGSWNYTRNTNRMANSALPAGVLAERVTWWRLLDGMDGPPGAAFLDQIIRGLEADPEHFRSMNPDNRWGDYDSFLGVLREMRSAVPEWPCAWVVSG